MKNNYSVFLRALIFSFIFLMSVNSKSFAQQFTRLTSNSEYACIKFPSGKFGVGKATKSGYAVRSFNVASKEISTILSQKRETLRTKQSLFNDFLKDNEITKIQLQNIINIQFNLGTPPKTVSKVLKFNSLLNKLKDEISALNNELDALRDCQKGKTEFKSFNTAKMPQILAQNATQIVLTSLLEIDYPGKYDNSFKAFFCIQKESESLFTLTAAYKNPCSESNLGAKFDDCLAPNGKLHIPLVLSYLSANSSQQFIINAQSDIDKNYSGNYTIKSISDNPNSPCGYLNK